MAYGDIKDVPRRRASNKVLVVFILRTQYNTDESGLEKNITDTSGFVKNRL